jgi:hypothetical protein
MCLVSPPLVCDTRTMTFASFSPIACPSTPLERKGLLGTLALAMAVLFLFAGPSLSFASATDIYLANSAQGAGDGSSCTNAKVWTFFNTAGNWGSGSTQIGPGTTVHVCGTISDSGGGSMVFQGSGASGNPITVKFEANAILQSTGWGEGDGEGGCPCRGAFTVSGQSNIVIDGGGTPNTGANPAGLAVQNGIIQNTTASGGNIGIYVNNTTNVTIKNLVIQNIHSNSSAFDRAATDIIIDGTNSNLVIQNNLLNNGGTGAEFLGSEGAIPTQLRNNYFSDHCWQIFVAENLTDHAKINGNEITNWTNASACHTDGLFSNGGAPDFYNNYIHGDLAGPSPTAMVYCTYVTSPGATTSCNVFNNTFATNSPPEVLNGGNGGPENFLNNTVVGGPVLNQYEIQGTYHPATVENNIGVASSGGDIYQTIYGGSDTQWFAVSDYNDYYGFSSTGWDGNSLSTWHGLGLDTHSITTNPNLGAFPYALPTGSPAIGTGANLTSLCTGRLVALCQDRLGNARPTTGAWDMGATQTTQAANGPSAPTNLNATVN